MAGNDERDADKERYVGEVEDAGVERSDAENAEVGHEAAAKKAIEKVAETTGGKKRQARVMKADSG